MENQWLPDVEIPCPDDAWCPNTWHRWIIDAQKTLKGPPLTGRIAVANIQHAPYVRSHLRKFRLFLLRPIEDAGKRKLLRADYTLVDVSVPHEMYCLDKDTDATDIANEEYTSPERPDVYCFELRKEDEPADDERP